MIGWVVFAEKRNKQTQITELNEIICIQIDVYVEYLLALTRHSISRFVTMLSRIQVRGANSK